MVSAAAEDYFFPTIPRAGFSSVFINALPFNRKENSQQSLVMCATLLENPGNILILFPEGTRSPTGKTQQFKSGIARLVAGTDLKIFPCRLTGCYSAWGKGFSFPRPRKIKLVIGKSLVFENYSQDRNSLYKISAVLREAVLKLGETGPSTV